MGDTGSGNDLLGRDSLTEDEKKNEFKSEEPVRLATANGQIDVDTQTVTRVKALGLNIKPYVLESCPPVLSIGRRVMKEGYDWIWKRGRLPFLQKGLSIEIQRRAAVISKMQGGKKSQVKVRPGRGQGKECTANQPSHPAHLAGPSQTQ